MELLLLAAPPALLPPAAAPSVPVPPPLPELLEMPAEDEMPVPLESVALPDPPPQALSAAARIGRLITHDEFFKAETSLKVNRDSRAP
jgi:hypothetical protein